MTDITTLTNILFPVLFWKVYPIFTMGQEEHTPKPTNTTASSPIFTSARSVDNIHSLCYASNFDDVQLQKMARFQIKHAQLVTVVSNDTQVKWFVFLYRMDNSASTVRQPALQLWFTLLFQQLSTIITINSCLYRNSFQSVTGRAFTELDIV